MIGPCTYDCDNKTEFSYCKSTGCVNPKYAPIVFCDDIITDIAESRIITTNTYTTGSGTVDISGKLHLADDDDLIRRIMERLNFVPTIEHKCHNCGGVLEIRADEHLFRCPYCNSCYAIGINMKNDRG